MDDLLNPVQKCMCKYMYSNLGYLNEQVFIFYIGQNT